MKVFWKSPGQLHMEAESAAELEVIASLVHGGPLAGATWLRVPEDQLPFPREREGITTLIGVPCVVVGLQLQANMLVYKAAHTPAEQLRADTAARIGHSLLDAFELLGAHPK